MSSKKKIESKSHSGNIEITKLRHELAVMLSANIEIALISEEPIPEFRSNLDQANSIKRNIQLYEWRKEFQRNMVSYLESQPGFTEDLIKAMHTFYVGSEGITTYEATVSGLSVIAVKSFLSQMSRRLLLAGSTTLISVLYLNHRLSKKEVDCLRAVFLQQTLRLLMECLVVEYELLVDSKSTICMDCLGKEPIFKRLSETLQQCLTEESLDLTSDPGEREKRVTAMIKHLAPSIGALTEQALTTLEIEFPDFESTVVHDDCGPNPEEIH